MTGKELKEARERMCISQSKLGEMLGYTGHAALTVVQKWEYDVNPIPLKHFRKLAEILRVPLEKFIP